MDLSEFGSHILSALPLVMAVTCAFFLSIIIHELGHALVAKLLGQRVVACGIGAHDPWFHIRVGETCYYVARPVACGLTVIVDESFRPSRWKMIAVFAGGPIASLVLAIAALVGITWYGGHRHLGLGLAATSGWMFLATAFPRRTTVGRMFTANDAAVIVACWRDELDLLMEPGHSLTMCVAMRDLCRDLDSTIGQVFYTLHTALMQCALGEYELAAASLADPILKSPDRGTACQRLEAFVRGTLACQSRDDAQNEQLRCAKAALHDDNFGILSLELGEVLMAVERPDEAAALLENTSTRIGPSTPRILVSYFEAVRLVVQHPEDFEQKCRALLENRGHRRLDSTMSFWLSANAARILAERGEFDPARVFFQEAIRHLRAVAVTISDQSTRTRFLASCGSQLQEAVHPVDNTVPVFIPLRFDSDDPERTNQSPNGFTRLGKTLMVAGVFLLGLLLGGLLVANSIKNRDAERSAIPQPPEFDEHDSPR